jgi:O-antigen/teichoic acid export membrane protein
MFTVVKKNIVANFVSSGWTALLALVLIPVYIKFLGIEAWGVIGIFTALQSLAFVVDFGLSSTLNREMARLSLRPEKAREMRDLVRTFELIYWGIATAIGASLFVLAPLIARRWIQGNQLSPQTIGNAMALMSLALAFYWPFVLYSGGLLGLQRQVLLSGISVSMATLRGFGAVFIVWQVSATLQAFFTWQILMSLFQTCMAGVLFWRSLPRAGERSRFQRQLLRARWRFAAGMSAVSVISGTLMQMDKIILSRILNLKVFGYYVLAGSLATSVYLMIMPLFYAVYPKFTQMVSLGDQEELRKIYHHSCQLMSVLIFPITILVMFFSPQILLVWTGNPTTVEYTYLILSILITGAAATGLMQLPYAVQLAHGWTRLALSINVVSAFVLIPLVVLMASYYGAPGAALSLVIFNSGVAIVNVELTHRRFLKGEQWRWYFVDVGLPLMVSLATAVLCLMLIPTNGSRWEVLLVLAAVFLLLTSATIVATPVTRQALVVFWRRLSE